MKLEPRSTDLLVDILAAKMPCLENVDISWNRMGASQIRRICEAARPNHYLRSLSLAHNPVSRTDPLLELGQFIRRSAGLQHLDLSGVLQTPAQVKRVVKKVKRSASLLAVHLSHTPCIKADVGLQLYIRDKLHAKNCLDEGKQKAKQPQAFE